MNYANNCSLFISFTTVPIGNEKESREDLQGIINGYKEKQKKFGNLLKQNKNFETAFDKYFYKPSFYILYGSYDLAVISLVDDYTLASRNFHPYSYFIDSSDRIGSHPSNFKYQIISGTAPIVEKELVGIKSTNSDLCGAKNPLIKKAKSTFLLNTELDEGKAQTKKLYPFIAFTRIKVNNGLLLGAGAKFVALIEMILHQYLKEKIYPISNAKGEIYTDFILTESIGWHELTLTIFSNDLKVISDIIIGIRQWRLQDLKQFVNDERLGFSDKDKEHFAILYEQILEESLINSVIGLEKKVWNSKKESDDLYSEYESSDFMKNVEEHTYEQKRGNKNQEQGNIEAAHIFIKTLTSFGFDYHLLEDYNNQELRVERYYPFYHKNDEAEHLFIKWLIKPGHLKYLLKEFNDIDCTEDDRASFVAGMEDYIFPFSSGSVGFSQVFELERQLLSDNKKSKFISRHVKKLNSLIGFRYTFNELFELIATTNEKKNVKGKHKVEAFDLETSKEYLIHDRLIHFTFSLPKLKKLRRLLYRCNVSKILREKVLNMFVNYNDGIRDNILFPYFIGLRPFLKEIIEVIKMFGSDVRYYDGHEVENVINTLVDQFEMAYKNRFLQSYRMDGVTDFNIEFNGGCQQIIFALEGTYKAIATAFGDKSFEPTSFVFSSGLSGVTSSQFSMRLNYFHLFQPSIFFAPSVKEASNQIFQSYRDTYDSIHYQYRTIIRSSLDDAIQTTKSIIYNNYSNYKLTFGQEEVIDSFICSSLSDIFSFHYGYNSDVEQFTFWYWSYFLQMSEMYNTASQINHQTFVKFLARYIIVMVHSGHSDELEKFNEDIENNRLYPCRQIRGLWLSHYYHVLTMSKDIISEDKNPSYYLILSCASRWGFSVMAVDLVSRPKELLKNEDIDIERVKEMQAKNLQSYEDKIFKSYDPNILIYRNRRKEQYRQLLNKTDEILADYYKRNEQEETYEEIKESTKGLLHYASLRATLVYKRFFDLEKRMQKGEIYQYRFKSKDEHSDLRNESPTLYIQTLLYGYLKLLHDSFFKKEQYNGKPVYFSPFPIWQRNDFDIMGEGKSGIVKEELEKGQVMDYRKILDLNKEECPYDADLYFDPMGGLHSSDFKTRRQYYQFRSTIIRSLWDFSLKYQKRNLE